MANTDIPIEFLVPGNIAPALKSVPGLDVRSVQKVDEDELQFGILELVAILAVVKTTLSITQTALSVYKMLKELGDPSAKAYIRSPTGHATITISASNTEQGITDNITDVYGLSD